MNNEELQRTASKAMKRPEGSFVARAEFDGPGLLQVVAGAHVFRVFLETEAQVLTFVHASPGTGTRATRADVSAIYPALLEQENFIAITWSPAELFLSIGARAPRSGLIRSGETVPYVPTLMVGTNGEVHEIGSSGVSVANARVWVDGRQELSPSGIELWSSTRAWSRTIRDVLSEEPPFHEEVAVCNAAFVSLITGYEVYLQARFAELCREGIPVDREAIRRRLPGEVGRAEDPNDDEFAKGLSEAVSFQSWSRAKDAYAAGYCVRFGTDLKGISSSDLERIQRLLKYRHRMIHADPMSPMLNPMFHDEDPEFSGRDFVAGADEVMNRFIGSLHAATLRLRPPDVGREPLLST